jgi:soluble calcium-activated nucleotidase 1
MYNSRKSFWQEHAKKLAAAAAALLVILFFLKSSSSAASTYAAGSAGTGLFPDKLAWQFSNSAQTSDSWRIAVVSDLDKKSKVADAKKPTFRAVLKTAELQRNAGGQYAVVWDSEHELKSQLNEAGRGMELSALTPWHGRLYTMDDRSGAVFEVTTDFQIVPRFILMEGDGATGKGFKTEWATVKDGVMVVGSFGKEYTNNDGSVRNRNNLWVKLIDAEGRITHVDWTSQYDALRRATNTVFPGYMIIEAVEWSAVHQRWFVLPRRVSPDPYDEVKDETRGSNGEIGCIY